MSTPEEEVAARPTRRWSRADGVAVGVIGVVSLVLRLVRLGTPSKQIFDEVFYARDACWYFIHRASTCGISKELNLEHPPLGKDLIGLGIKAFGFNAFGWRIVAAVFGALLVVLTYLLARELLKSTWASVAASSLVTIDFLAFVHSRIAMLDIFVACFIIAAFLFVAYDHADMAERKGRVRRPWRLAAGIACGLAISTKWSAIFAVAAVVLLSLAWEMNAAEGTRRSALWRVTRREGFSFLAAFVGIPFVLYCLAFIGHIHGDLLVAPWREGAWFHELYQRQIAAGEYHLALTKTNPLQSAPWSWLALKRAFPYFRDITDSGQRLTVQAGGSPVTWWLAIPAILWVTVVWLKHNSPARPEGVIVAGFWMNFLPWAAFSAAPFLLGSARSGMYLFYALPLVPFMCIAQALAAQKLWRWIAGRVVVALVAVAAVACFAFYYPFLTAMPLSEEAWRARIWIFDNCERPDRAPLVVIRHKTEHGTLTTQVTSLGRHFLPPLGWCWIEYGKSNVRIGLKDILTPTK